ncbi:MAG: DnaD domain protein [Oscillospiraceae bacterium]|nr:DnaD domain protein [Oscillospiraceae bacterium]
MDYFLNAGPWGAIFAVPNAVVDNYIKLASGNAVKVLLYILRNNGKQINISEICTAININEDDVKDAFNFWQEVGILGTLTNEKKENKSDIQVQPPAPVTEKTEKQEIKEKTEEAQKTPPNQAPVKLSSSTFNILPSEIEKMKNESKEIKNLLEVAQSCLGGMINNTMTRSLIWQHEYLGLNIDVILMLLTYCSSVQKANIAYIDTIAIDWYKNDINTLEKAQNEIERISKVNTFNREVYKSFGLTREPTENQKKFFDQWRMKGYSTDLINFACEKMIDTGKKLTVNYVNGILENWRKKGITTLEQAQQENKNFKKKPESQYDVSEFTRDLAITLTENTNKGI